MDRTWPVGGGVARGLGGGDSTWPVGGGVALGRGGGLYGTWPWGMYSTWSRRDG